MQHKLSLNIESDECSENTHNNHWGGTFQYVDSRFLCMYLKSLMIWGSFYENEDVTEVKRINYFKGLKICSWYPLKPHKETERLITCNTDKL